LDLFIFEEQKHSIINKISISEQTLYMFVREFFNVINKSVTNNRSIFNKSVKKLYYSNHHSIETENKNSIMQKAQIFMMINFMIDYSSIFFINYRNKLKKIFIILIKI